MVWWEFRILLVGLLIASSCSLLSVYVVLKRMAMISEGVSHAGFGGMGVAVVAGFFLASWSPFFAGEVFQQIVIGVFCLATAMLIGYVTRAKKVSEDSAIGIFLVASMALGMLLLSIRPRLGPTGALPSVERALFGSFTAVTNGDLMMAAVVTGLVVLVIALYYHELLYFTLDENMARVNGVRTSLVHTLLLLLISLIIVVGVRMVGFLMITAMTIIPGATANLLARRFHHVLGMSVLVGVGGTAASLMVSLNPPLDTLPPGPLLVLTLFGIFVVAWVIRHATKGRGARG